jgi:hypothetical protein
MMLYNHSFYSCLIEFYHVDFQNFVYGGLVINEVKEVHINGRICESAFQISVESEYIDQALYKSQLLPTNEVLVQLPSVSATFLDNACYHQIMSGWNILNAGDAWQPHFATSQDVMRSALTSCDCDHLKVRVVVLTFPDDYRVSNEIFSYSTHLGHDTRATVYVSPCTVQYLHGNKTMKHDYFRLCWRYNKSMDRPRTTNVGIGTIEAAFNSLNSYFSSTPNSI